MVLYLHTMRDTGTLSQQNTEFTLITSRPVPRILRTLGQNGLFPQLTLGSGALEVTMCLTRKSARSFHPLPCRVSPHPRVCSKIAGRVRNTWFGAPLGLFDLGTRNLLIMSGVYKQRRGLTIPSHSCGPRTFAPVSLHCVI